jgi:hypothetical protein
MTQRLHCTKQGEMSQRLHCTKQGEMTQCCMLPVKKGVVSSALKTNGIF